MLSLRLETSKQRFLRVTTKWQVPLGFAWTGSENRLSICRGTWATFCLPVIETVMSCGYARCRDCELCWISIMLEAKAKMEAIEDKLDQLGETLKGQAGSIEMCDLHRQLAPTLKYAMRFMRWNQSGREWIELRTWSRDRHPVQLRPWPRRGQVIKCIVREEKLDFPGVLEVM